MMMDLGPLNRVRMRWEHGRLVRCLHQSMNQRFENVYESALRRLHSKVHNSKKTHTNVFYSKRFMRSILMMFALLRIDHE